MAASRKRTLGMQMPTVTSARHLMQSTASTSSSKVQPMDCTSVPEESEEDFFGDTTLHPWCRHIENILHRSHEDMFMRLDAWMSDFLSSSRVTFSEDVRPPYSNRPSSSSTHRPSTSSLHATERRYSQLEISSTEDPIAALMNAERSERARPLPLERSRRRILDDEEHEKVALEKSKIRREWTERQGSKVMEHSLDEVRSFTSKVSWIMQGIVDSARFEAFFSFALLSNALFIGITLQLAADRYGSMPSSSTALEEGPVVTAIHSVYAVLFLVELVMRMAAHGRSFFCSYDRASLFWNYLDTVLVGISIVESILVIVLVEDTEIGMSNKLRTMRIVRLTRLVRLLRAVRFFAGLRTLIYSIFYTLKALGWSLILLLLMIYVLGILLTDATLAHIIIYENTTMIPDESMDGVLYDHFGSVHLSMHTLFRSITGGLDWSMVADAMAPLNWIWVYLFTAYIAFCLFAVLNVMTGVFCQRATELAERDHEAQLLGLQMENDRIRMESRNLFRRFDVAKQGSLTLLEFELMFQRDDIKASLQVLDIEVSDADAWRFFRLLDTDGNGDVNEEDFIEGVMHLRGPARTIDVACEAEENRRMKAKLGHMESQDRRTELLLRSMATQLTQLSQRMEDLRSEGGAGCAAKPTAGKDSQEGVDGEEASTKDSPGPPSPSSGSPTCESRADASCFGHEGTSMRETREDPKPPDWRPTSPPPPPPPQSPSLRLLASPSSPKGTPVFLLDPAENMLQARQAASDRVHQQIEQERLLKWDFDLHYDMDPRMATRGTKELDTGSRGHAAWSDRQTRTPS